MRDALAAARARLPRLTAVDAHRAQLDGALLIDVRTAEQRTADGLLPGAVVLALNVLEWRLDPDEPRSIPEAGQYDRQVVVICDEGYCSSLAAARLLDLGYHRATDVVDGFGAWRRSGLPVTLAHPVRSPGTSRRGPRSAGSASRT